MPNGVPYITGYKDFLCVAGLGIVQIVDQPKALYLDYATPTPSANGEPNYYDGMSLPLNTLTGIVKSDGTLWLWGCNSYGQLGNNGINNSSSPVQTVSTGTNWCWISTGHEHAAAIKTDGTLWSWGRGTFGQLGNFCSARSWSSPVQTVSTGTNWKKVYAAKGGYATYAIKTDGTLWTWGCNGYGNLGNNNRNNQSSPAQTVSTGTNWCDIIAADVTVSVAAIKNDGTLWTWGFNGNSSLGNNDTIDQSSPVQTITQGTNWRCVVKDTESGVTAAVKTDGTLWLWGYNTWGQLGGGSTAFNYSSPIQTVCQGNNWKNIALSYRGALASKTDGTLWTWGTSVVVGGNNTYYSPIILSAEPNSWNSIRPSACGYHLSNNAGKLYAIGYNSTTFYPLGFVFEEITCVDLGTQFVEKDYYLNVYSNIIPTVKVPALYGIGDGSGFGLLGRNSTLCSTSLVQTISSGTNWQQISAGLFSVASVKTDGTLWLWGCNGSGNLGNNDRISRSSPVQTVATGTNWKQVSVGNKEGFAPYTGAAIKTDGTLWTWGSNNNGQLGNNNTIARSSPVQTVSTGTNWSQVSAGDCHMAAIKTDGTLWLWGAGICNGVTATGALGNNNTIARSSPVQTSLSGTNWRQVSVSGASSAAVTTEGRLYVWGGGVCGKLGNNSTINRSAPVQTISTATNWKYVDVGTNTIAAIKTDGTLWVWGAAQCGVLGNNCLIDRSSPVQTVSLGTNWKQVSVGTYSMASIKSDGTLWGWGCNPTGQLGTNNKIPSSTPVQITEGNNWRSVATSQSAFHALSDENDL